MATLRTNRLTTERRTGAWIQQEYPGQVGFVYAFVNRAALILFWIDLPLLIADAFSFLNPSRRDTYIIIDTITSIALIGALILKIWLQQRYRNVKSPRLAWWEILLIALGSLPLPLLLQRYLAFSQQSPVELARLTRVFPRMFRGTRIIRLLRMGRLGQIIPRLILLSDNMFAIGILASILWPLAMAFLSNSKYQSQFILLAYLWLSVVLFSLIFELRQRLTSRLWQKYFATDVFQDSLKDLHKKSKELNSLIKKRTRRDDLVLQDDRFETIQEQIDEFSTRDIKEIEIGHVRSIIEILNDLSGILLRDFHKTTKGSFTDEYGSSKSRHLTISEHQTIRLAVEETHKQAQNVLRSNLLARSADLVLHSMLFVILFQIIDALAKRPQFRLSHWFNINAVSEQFSPLSSLISNLPFPSSLVLGLLAISLFYLVVKHAINIFTQATATGLDDLIGAFVALPATAILFMNFLHWIVDKNGSWIGAISVTFANSFHSISLWAMWIWVSIGVYNGTVIFLLKRRAEQTESKFDDVLVKLLQRFGVLTILLFAIVALIPSISGGKSLSTNEGILAALVATLASAGLLFIGRDFAENFFAGIYIMITRPFEQEDFVQIGDQIYSVREIGLFGTKLYKILENTEVLIPNTDLARQGVLNLSKPDSRLRLHLAFYTKDNLELVTTKLVDIMLNNEEVEKLKTDDIKRARELLSKISNGNPSLKKICQEVDDQLNVDPPTIKSIALAVSKAADMLNKPFELAKPNIRALIHIFSLYPVITSQFEISEDGVIYSKITIYFYTKHIQRHKEVLHNLNMQIQRKLKQSTILTPIVKTTKRPN